MIEKIKKSIKLEIFVVPAMLILIVLFIGFFFPEQLGEFISIAFSWTVENLGWFYSLGTFLLIPFCLYAGFSKIGNIKLGGPDAKPDMSKLNWIIITFTSGMALGVVFYGVGEGLSYFMNPPTFTTMQGGSIEAAENALKYVFVHWGVQAYSIYTAAALGFVLVFWNLKQKFALNIGLYPLLNNKADGLIGNVVNWLCLYVLVASLGTNVGLGTLQISSGLSYIFNIEFSTITVQIFIIVTLATIGIISACSGVHKGIKYISQLNMIIFVILLAMSFAFGGTTTILNNTISSVGKYLSEFIPQGLYTEPFHQTGWTGSYTIYYWAWWLTVAPLTGLFLAKLGKGRTIREFVLVNLFIPVGFIFIWFGTFGTSAIMKQMQGVDIWGTVEEFGFPVAFFAYLDTLPIGTFMMIVGLLAVLLSFITQSESMIFTLAEMTSHESYLREKGKSSNALKVFWGIAISVFGFVLIQSGGLVAVQTSVVMLGFPILVLVLVNAVGFLKLANEIVKEEKQNKEEGKK